MKRKGVPSGAAKNRLGGSTKENAAAAVDDVTAKPEVLREQHTVTYDRKPITHFIGGCYSWSPKPAVAFRLLLAARLVSALWCHITDCDETYNYWEPLHYLMYGSGFQTWEYSPVYALRSYAYVWMHALPVYIQQIFFENSKLMSFYLVRSSLAVFCALFELLFYNAVRKSYGGRTASLWLAFQLFSPGMYIAASAFLPSSFALYMTLLTYSSLLTGSLRVAVGAVATSAILGWPFAALTGVPVALDLVFARRRIGAFLSWSFLFGATTAMLCVFVDSYQYGRVVLAALNILKYNVFASGETGGSALYGVEPPTFYLYNGFLNYGPAFLLALAFIPIAFAVAVVYRWPRAFVGDLVIKASGMFLWLVIFTAQAHKEERFLFPIYPLLAFFAALLIAILENVIRDLSMKWAIQKLLSLFQYSTLLFVVISALIGASRIAALMDGYRAPLNVYGHLVELDQALSEQGGNHLHTVCVGREWHRFPTSFFLPNDNWQLSFIKSGFKGLLPKPFEGLPPVGTRVIPSAMNAANREEPSRYVQLANCDYLVDIDVYSEFKFEPNFVQLTEEWRVLYADDYLDALHSSRLYRAFYVPFVSSRHVAYVRYALLEPTPLFRSRTKAAQRTFINANYTKV